MTTAPTAARRWMVKETMRDDWTNGLRLGLITGALGVIGIEALAAVIWLIWTLAAHMAEIGLIDAIVGR